MFKNHLKIALRSLHRQKGYAVINVLGLALGIACAVVILQFVRRELSYETFYPDADRIYRLVSEHAGEVTPSALGPLLARSEPAVERAVRVYDRTRFSPVVVRHGENVFQESRFLYADSTFFELFPLRFQNGSAATALTRPNTVVITHSTAQKYFGEEDPIGKSLLLNNRTSYEVTGVVEDVPFNTHLPFDVVASLHTLNQWPELSDTEWRAANFFTYVLLREPGAKAGVDAALAALIEREIGERLRNTGQAYSATLQELRRIHLDAQSAQAYVYIFSAIAMLVLLVACINYMNLATARAMRRAKEVGVRKVAGASRRHLLLQFYGESGLLAGFALVVSLLIIELMLPLINAVTGVQIVFDYSGDSIIPLYLMGAWLLVTLVAGSYPALVLSSFAPAEVLKSGRKAAATDKVVRRGLVVFQFSASAFLILGTMVIVRQLDYMQNVNLNAGEDQVVVLPAGDVQVSEAYPALKPEWERIAGVQAVSAVNATPGLVRAGYLALAEGMSEHESLRITGFASEADVFRVLDFNLIAGRGFDHDAGPERGYRYVLNETAVRALGWTPDDAVGKWLNLLDERRGEVVGVVQDFHFVSLHEPITPLAIFPEPREYSYLLVRIGGGQVPETVEAMKAVWTQLVPHRPFEVTFLSQEYDALYRSEAQASRIVGALALLAIFIASLGLFGLAAFTAEQRTKEIGVRKVLGASVAQIVLLFSADFVRLVALATVMAVPAGYYILNRWLEGFAYRIHVEWWMFAVTGLIALVAALLTVSYQSIKAALADPVKSLRHE